MNEEEYRTRLLEIFTRHFTLIAEEVKEAAKECEPKDNPAPSPSASKTQQQHSLDYPPYDVKWTEYASGKGVWTFSNQNPVRELVCRLKATKGKTLAEVDWKYRLSGEDKFLQAFPIKKETSP